MTTKSKVNYREEGSALLESIPDDWDHQKHLALKATDFDENFRYLYYDWQIVGLQKRVAALQTMAEFHREKVRVKLSKLLEQRDSISQQIEGLGNGAGP